MTTEAKWKKNIPHPAFRQPDEDVEVWRYMDLARFVWMLSHRAIHLSRADLLGDTFEGSVPRRFSMTWTDSQRKESGISKVFAELLESDFRKVRQAYIRTIQVHCWRHGLESEAMWRLYCGPNEGVAIVTTYNKLFESITDRETRIGLVTYLNYQEDVLPDTNYLRPIMCKRVAFAHEQEVRLVRWQQADTDAELSGRHPEPKAGFKMRWNPTPTLDRVVVSPYASEWYVDTVRQLLAKWQPSLVKNLSWSELRENPVY